jgi:hypothetical protein
VEDVQAAVNLKKKLWGENLENVLEEILFDGTIWRYVSKETVKSLELNRLGYFEPQGLLVRPEYDAALGSEMLDRENAQGRNCRGVVVFGHAGIGVLSSLIIE